MLIGLGGFGAAVAEDVARADERAVLSPGALGAGAETPVGHENNPGRANTEAVGIGHGDDDEPATLALITARLGSTSAPDTAPDPDAAASPRPSDREPDSDARAPGLSSQATATAGAATPGSTASVDDTAARVAAVLRQAEESCQRLLELAHFVATTADSDSRGPCVDVFVIAALDDAEPAAVVSIIEQLAQRLRSRFRPVLGVGQGRLCVCPLLLIPRPGSLDGASYDTRTGDGDGADDGAHTGTDPARVGAAGPLAHASDPCDDALRKLAKLAQGPELARRPGGRIYLLEDQSGKYVLPRRELVGSFGAFLHLLIHSGLRTDSSIRNLVEASEETPQAPFASFACATLDVGTPSIHELCALSLGDELLASYDVDPPALSEVASDAAAMLPKPCAIADTLWQEGERSLEEYLEAPTIDVPRVAWDMAPEDITEAAFGPTWQLGVERSIRAFRDRVETLQMDRLAEQIERNGTASARALTAEWATHAAAEVKEGPRGLARGLALIEYAADDVRGHCERAKRRLDAPELRGFPTSPLEDRLEAVYEAADAWPRHRPPRMRLFVLMSLLCGSAVFAGFIQLGASWLGYPLPWWASLLAGIALYGPGVSYELWRHRKRHYNWLEHARDELHQALERHVRRELVAYFRGRLSYSRDLWQYRIYRLLQSRLDTLAATLRAARAAVRTARDTLKARAHARLAQLTSQHPAGPRQRGILYHVLVDPAAVTAIYRYVRPPEISALARRFHAQLSANGHQDDHQTKPDTSPTDPDSGPLSPILEAPFADLDQVMHFCRRELESLRVESPFDAAVPPLREAARAGTRTHLARLVRKLSLPLELTQSDTHDTPRPRHLVIAPPEAAEPIDELLAPLDQRWQLHSDAQDPQRIHLLIVQQGLPLAAIARLGAINGRPPARQVAAEHTVAPPSDAERPA